MTRLNRFTGSLLSRLIVGYVLVALVLSSAWILSLYGPLTDAAIRQQQRNLTAVANSAALLVSESSSTPEQLARQLVARTDLRLTVVAADGRVLADSDYDVTRMANHRDRPEVAAALGGRAGVDRRLSQTGNIEELYVAVPGSLDGSRVAVRVAQPLAEIAAIAGRSRRIGLGLLAVALIVAAFVAVRAAQVAAAPVRELSTAAERMAAGDLDTYIPDMPRDLAGLSNALAMLRDEAKTRIGALDAERSTLSATLDGVGDGVLLLEGHTARFANREFSRLFRTPSSGLNGTPLEATGLPAPVVEAVRARIASGSRAPVELAADPLGRSYRVFVSPLPPAGSDPRFVVVVSDVTERARVDRVRRDFVANASHELKTPVAGIRLLADSAGTAASDGDTETSLAFTRQIAAEAERLQHLVGDLLALSRLDTTPVAGTLTDMREAVDRAMVSHRPQAGRKGLELQAVLEAVAGQSVFVTVDPTDVAIALDNLIDNAIAYTDKGTVTVAVDADSDTVAIRVSDTGPGIPAEQQGRVFERFYRVDPGRSRESGGTGLGLALVRHVAQRAGGSVTLISEPGVGSTFTLRLPRAT